MCSHILGIYAPVNIELEIQLRDHCRKIRIHTQLSGAHMIFPQEQGLAIRFYYEPPIQSIEDNSNADPDGILDFCYAFQWTLVLFVLPDVMTNEQSDMHIFMQQSMQLLDQPIPPAKKQQHRPPRFLVVSNTEQALVAIMECAEAITPSRCALRAKYFEKIRNDHYIPVANVTPNHSNNTATQYTGNDKENVSTELQDDPTINETAVAAHYAKAIREWCDRVHVPEGEADVILHVLPTLQQLVHAVTDKNQNGNILNNVPIEENTKRKLRHFITARDGDDDTNYIHDDCLDSKNQNMNHLDASASIQVTSPPSFYYAVGQAHIYGDQNVFSNTSAAVSNQYNYRREEDSFPHVLTQDGMDVDGFPAATTLQPLYHPQPSGYIQPPLHHHDGDFHHHFPRPHDPSPFESYNYSSMYRGARSDPSAQQYHTYMAEPLAMAKHEQQHQQNYNGRSPLSLQQHHLHYPRNTLQSAEKMAKVLPWGQPPPMSMDYTPHQEQSHYMHFPNSSAVPHHLHQQPSSQRVSLNTYPPAPSVNNNNSFYHHSQQQSYNMATVTPYHGNHLLQHQNHQNENNINLKKVVRRFM